MKKIQFELSERDAITLQKFWGSWFGNGNPNVNLGDLQRALDALQYELWNKMGERKQTVARHEEGDGC